MNSEKNSSSRRRYLVNPFTKSTMNISSDIQEINMTIKDTLWTEAWTKTKWTVNALMNMCYDCNMNNSEFCKAFEQVQDVVIILAKKGFTVLEMKCQRGVHHSIPQSCVPLVSWQSVCVYCPEQHLTHEKETCLQNMIERELRILQLKQVHITELLCLHNTIQNAYFLD